MRKNLVFTEEVLRGLAKNLIGKPVTMDFDEYKVVGHITSAVVNVKKQSILSVIELNDGKKVEVKVA